MEPHLKAQATHGSEISRPSTAAKNQAQGAVVCVYCGASEGEDSAHMKAAHSLAVAFAAHKIKLVYGGGTKGLMGEIARTLVSLSGPDSVHGIIPQALMKFEQEGRPDTTSTSNIGPEPEIDQAVYGRMTMVPDMHTRKQLMAKEVMEGGPGSGFVALSGGYGTLEELMEMITWNQLGIHGKGVVVYNVEGYYDGLIQWIQTAVSSRFITNANAGILVQALDAEEVVKQLQDYRVSEERFDLDWSQK